MKLHISKLAHELLGDDLPKLEALARQEIAQLRQDADASPGPFLHTLFFGKDAMDRGEIYAVHGRIEEDGSIEAYIQRGFWASAGFLPDDHKIEELRGKEIKMPKAVDSEDNRLYRVIEERERQQ